MPKQPVRTPGDDPQTTVTDEAEPEARSGTDAPPDEPRPAKPPKRRAGGPTMPQATVIRTDATPPPPEDDADDEDDDASSRHAGRPTPDAAAQMSAKQLTAELSKLPPAAQGYMLSRTGWACGKDWHTRASRRAQDE